jgi:hypothetical protein
MRAISRFFISTVLLTTFFAALTSYAAEPGGKEAVAEGSQVTKPDSKPSRPRITVSKETTYITAPLLPNGYPDYLRAMNEHYGKGVTAENNAAVPFWQAIGPKEIPAEYREQFFKLLGMPVLPDKGPYLVSFEDFKRMKIEKEMKGREEAEINAYGGHLDDEYDNAMMGPWSAEKYPEEAEWLKLNEGPLSLIVEGAKRERLFWPWIIREDGWHPSEGLLPGMSESRQIIRLLQIRSMLRLKTGKIDEAWQDLLACHRLARLFGQGPSVIALLISYALEGIAWSGDMILSSQGNLSANQALQFLSDMIDLPPPPNLADLWNIGERYYNLGFVLRMAEDKSEQFSTDLYGTSNPQKLKKMISDPRVDWDEVLRFGNAHFDRIVEGYRKTTYKDRYESLDKYQKETKDKLQKVIEPTFLNNALYIFAKPQAITSDLAVALWSDRSDLGTAKAVIFFETRRRLNISQVQLAFALKAYHKERGRYPAALAELKPKYLSEIPKDLFTDKELVYKPQENGQGYLLYSLGPNGRDDGGENYDDNPDKYKDLPNDKRPDDIAIHMP